MWIDQARFVEMLNQALNSVTPEEARKAAGNNRGYLHSMLMQMQRLQLTDSHLDTLREVAIDDEQSVDSHSDYNEGLQSQDYQQFINGIKFLYKDLSHNNKKSESFDNMLLLSTFRILVDNDLNNLKDLETLFINTSISELFLELYFYNVHISFISDI